MAERFLTRRRLDRFRSLPARDRRLFLSAVGLLSVVRLALWLTSFRRVQGAFERATAPRHGAPDPTPGEADRIGWAVGSAARFVPAASCLPQALAAEALLRRRGHPANLRLGVSRTPAGVEAHAWVESYGRVVVGDHELEQYTRLEGSKGS
jgi:Transglutaminase-like superfamily